MNSIQEAISQNEAAVIAAVLDALPVRLAHFQVIPKDKEEILLERERKEEIERQIPIIDPEKQIEIADGKIEVKEMAGAKSGGTAVRLIIEIGVYVEANKLGRVYGPDTTFTFGKNERMPDVSFVPAKKIPKKGEPLGKWKFAPDLAVEVVSPSDPLKKIRGRLEEFFAAGVKEVWIVEPEVRILSVYHDPLKPTAVFTKGEEMTGSIVLPDFRLQLSEIFID